MMDAPAPRGEDAASYVPGPLLGPHDPPVVTHVNPEGRAPLLLVADHAGRAIPAALDRLGLDDAALSRHIAYDIGIVPLARRLAERLDAPCIMNNYSRLVIDPNRSVDDPTSICLVSDGTVVPGNRGLTETDQRLRARTFCEPYHRAIDSAIAGFEARGIAPALVSLHSFTPEFRGGPRPWHIGVLYDEDDRMPRIIMHCLAIDSSLCIGDNQPYSGRRGYGYTVDTHAMARGLPNALIEVRQDLIADPADAVAWADRLAGVFADVLAALGLAPATAHSPEGPAPPC